MERVRRDQNKKADALSKLASMTLSKLAKEVLVEVLHEKSIVEKEMTDIIKEDGENWMAPIREYLLLGKLPNDSQKAKKIRIKAPQYKMIDNDLYRNMPNTLIDTEETKAGDDIYNVSVAFSQWGIDIVGPLPIAPGGARQKEKKRRKDLDILEERREIAAIKEAYYKQKLERYYNKHVLPSTFKQGTYAL
ncbi:hypothetical protein Tco_0936697 [Tanacetum coccineum]|uniref:Reverse transcriptase domain-containing protein n=1 Tax=Tanacetum coccineum TaxID=301880 RepID=A0ABQ5DD87_9ASTR